MPSPRFGSRRFTRFRGIVGDALDATSSTVAEQLATAQRKVLEETIAEN